jgi:predicted transposase YdaD
LDEVYAEGEQKGKLEGKLEGDLERALYAAKKALNMGLSIEQAAEISSLDVEKIKNELLVHA